MEPSSVVQAFDPLCEVQSDKASVEITSPFEGIVKEILVKEGEMAKVGENLCMIEVEVEANEDAGNAAASDHEEAVSTTVAPGMREEELNTPKPPKQPHHHDPRIMNNASHERGREVLALPSVRHFAKEKGVDLSLLVPGSGRGGRVEKKDVETHLLRMNESSPGYQYAEQPLQDDVVVELGRTRYGMWKAMVKVRYIR